MGTGQSLRSRSWVAGDAITLDYRIRSGGEDWQPVQQRVPIRWTPCRFGGERPWFVCDVRANGVYCGRQVAKLYGAGRLFACRHCYGLGYAVQRGGPMDSAHHRLRRLHRKLGANYDGPDGIPPPKPKWMRWRTYSRIALADRGWRRTPGSRLHWRGSSGYLPGWTSRNSAEGRDDEHHAVSH